MNDSIGVVVLGIIIIIVGVLVGVGIRGYNRTEKACSEMCNPYSVLKCPKPHERYIICNSADGGILKEKE